MVVFFFKQKTAYELRISDWSSDVCSSDLCCCLGWFNRLRCRNGCERRPIVLWPFFRVQRLGGGCGQKACAESRVEKVFRFFRADRRRAGYQNNLLVLRKLLNFADRKSTRLNSSH